MEIITVSCLSSSNVANMVHVTTTVVWWYDTYIPPTLLYCEKAHCPAFTSAVIGP